MLRVRNWFSLFVILLTCLLHALNTRKKPLRNYFKTKYKFFIIRERNYLNKTSEYFANNFIIIKTT